MTTTDVDYQDDDARTRPDTELPYFLEPGKATEAVVNANLVDEIHDEITGLAYELERASRRLRTWCTERPTDYAIVRELACGVAISAERIAAQLKERTSQLKPLIYGREGAEETERLREQQELQTKRLREQQEQREREREERRRTQRGREEYPY